jgi:HlyD family secretion protein
MTSRHTSLAVAIVAFALTVACKRADEGPPRASGYVEATDVRVAAKLPGRVAEVKAVEGARVAAGDTLVVLTTSDLDTAIARATAERDQARAQVRLLEAGPRREDVQQAESQVAVAAADRKAADADLTAARADEARFEQLLRNRAGSQKQRDDAVARRELAEARLHAADDRIRAAESSVARVKAGARVEELQGARARVRAIDAQIAGLEHDRAEATVLAPTAGVVSSRLVEPGELVAAGTPLVILIDLDRAWVNAYVEEPLVPSLRIDAAVTVVTDAGDRLPGRVAFIAPRAEFTPRNVQTADERARLVYRVKITVDNTRGVLKPGMPVEVELAPAGVR